MLQKLTPAGVPVPASNYAQGIVHPAGARRVVVAGQVGQDADGTILDGLEAQIARAFDNLLGVVAAAGLGPRDVVKITVFSTDPSAEAVAAYRRIRDEKLAGHAPAATYVVCAGLAHPKFLFEVEGEAVG